MVNVYVAREDATTPDGWTEVAAGYKDKLILGNGTGLETGGADTHNHTSMTGWSASSVTPASAGSTAGTGSNVIRSGYSHSHIAPASFTCTSTNHLPPYKNFRMLYRDVSGWNFVLPSGSICYKETTHAKYDRCDDGSSYFLRIAATAGGTGGATSHNHVASGNTGVPSGSNITCGTGSEDNWYSATHVHSFGFTSSSSTISYSYWSCGLVKSNDLTLIVKDLYLWFDGTPPAMFETVTDATDKYMKVSSDNSVAYATNSAAHTHTCSGTSGNSSGVAGANYDTTRVIGDTHTHSISFTLASVTPVPSYTRFTLAKTLYDIANSVIITII